MRKVLLAVFAVSMFASLVPAQAASVSYTRTIVGPTVFGGQDGVISLPSIINNPTDPTNWRKMNVVTRAARCAWEKGGANGQDGTTGKLGYVITLPALFTTNDTFTLRADASNANFDFDVYFMSSPGKCLQDVNVRIPLCQGEVPVGIEGPAPQPPAYENDTAYSSCGESGVYKRSVWTEIGNDAGTVEYNASHAVVVMPIGANGKFTLTVAGF